jgi:hypothetical protein
MPSPALKALEFELDTATFGDWLKEVEATLFPKDWEESKHKTPWNQYGTPESALIQQLSAQKRTATGMVVTVKPISPVLQRYKTSEVFEIAHA